MQTITITDTFSLGRTPLDGVPVSLRRFTRTGHNDHNKHQWRRRDSNLQFQQASSSRPTTRSRDHRDRQIIKYVSKIYLRMCEVGFQCLCVTRQYVCGLPLFILSL